MEEIHFVQQVKVTQHNKGSKMEGFTSVNSSALVNPICNARRNVEGSVCQKCYASNLLNMRKGLRDNTATNGMILQTYLISEQAWSLLPVNTIYARIESFGDVANLTQARNYIRIIRSHPLTNWGIWSKNAAIWADAFKLEGKPANCTYVHSSMMIGLIDTIPDAIAEYTDHVFTVFPKKTVQQINCGGLHCLSCLRCYKKDTEFEVSEMIK